jgi:hypothetical protein
VNDLPRSVARRIGPYYVYALVDPRDDTIFYVGKGTGQRLLSHGRAADLSDPTRRTNAKIDRIRAIRSAGLEPRIDVIRHGLDEPMALVVEAALIDALPLLTNRVAGHGAHDGRTPLEGLVRRYGAGPIPKHAPPALLIRLGPWRDERRRMPGGAYRRGHGYFEGMPESTLIDALRGWWRVNPEQVRRSRIAHAVAVVEGVTVAVVGIGEWERRADGRWAFGAEPASAGARRAWVGTHGRRVPFSFGAQNPVSYWSQQPKDSV